MLYVTKRKFIITCEKLKIIIYKILKGFDYN